MLLRIKRAWHAARALEQRELSPRLSRIPALDGIRGLAILAVLLCHSADRIGSSGSLERLLKNSFYLGWTGVDLFFVLSGFLITGILLRTKASSNYFQSFYMRRVLRIFPVYYFTLIATLLIVPHSAYLAGWLPPSGWQRASYFVYLQNFMQSWGPGWNGPNLLGPFWSLAVEEQFYLVWPCVVLLVSPSMLLRLCAILLAAAAPLRALAIQHWGIPAGFILWTTTRCDGLLVGAALAILLPHRRIPLPLIAAVSLASVGSLAFIFGIHPAALANPADDAYFCTFGVTALAFLFGSLIALALQGNPGIQHALVWPPLRSLGRYSYGMYVYHFIIFIVLPMQLMKIVTVEDSPFASLSFALLYIAFSIGVVYLISKLSFDLFESRMLAFKTRFAARDSSHPDPVSITAP